MLPLKKHELLPLQKHEFLPLQKQTNLQVSLLQISHRSIHSRLFRLQPILCHAELVQCEHLVMYDDREEEGRKVQLLYADRMIHLLETLGLESIATCKAIHCPHAFCVSFTTKAGFKIAYSGDTRPNPAFRDLGMMGGRGPDLLIHEATMEHFMINDARIKKHSTITEAVEEGEGMNAEFTLLTHFSQR